MKSIYVRSIAIIVSLVLLTSMLAGCKNDTDSNPDLADEIDSKHVFVPEFISLSALADDLPNMRNVTIAKDTLFFTTTNDVNNDALFHTTRIFALDLDGYVLSYLPNYTVAAPPPGAQGGGVYINSMQVDTDGNLWVAEGGGFVEFDFPHGFDLSKAETDEIWEHASSLESSYHIRKLDATGAELKSFDIGYLSETPDWIGYFSFHVDDKENIFISSGQTVFVTDADGKPLFSLDTETFLSHVFIRLSDGRVAFFDWGGMTTARSLRVIDVQTGAWGENIALPENLHNVFSGSEEYLVFINDGTNLSGIHVDTGEILPIINWMDTISVPVGLGNVTLLPDGRVMFTTATNEYNDDGSVMPRIELVTLNRMSREELPEKITLTMVTSGLDPDSTSVVTEFNRTNAFYQLELIIIEESFYTFSDDVGKLALDIITGNGPDIIHTSAVPFSQWAARGMFADLYDFIDADPTISRDDIIDVVLRNAETENKLYQIFSGFTVGTMVGHPDVVGSEPGWTFDELIAVLEANPQATSAFGGWMDGMRLFQEIFINHLDRFVNWETGIVDFDNDDFIEFLVFANKLRAVFNWWGDNRSDDGNIWFGANEPTLLKMISSGEIIIETAPIFCFNAPHMIKRYFGGDFIFKGYPTDSGSGNFMTAYGRFAISAKSENKQGAWEFIRMILSEEWQRKNTTYSFPSNKIVFEERLARARQGNEPTTWILPDFVGGRPSDPYAYTALILELINSVERLSLSIDPILDIVFEGLDDVFHGRSTPRQAARIIQSRAEIFVSEQS